MKIMKFVGAGWAIMGAGNIVLLSMNASSDGVLMAGLMVSMLLFILPGLVVYGIGKSGEPKGAAANRKRPKQVTEEEIKNWIKLIIIVIAGAFLFVIIDHLIFKK